MASVSRTHEFELWSRSRVGVGTDSLVLEAFGELSVADTEVCCDEISELTLVLKTACDHGTVRIDVDPTEGIGVALAEFAAKEFEDIHLDDWQEIAEETAEACESQYADHEIAWRKEHNL